jgi:formamidopyrimidine-DNA glycosylase
MPAGVGAAFPLTLWPDTIPAHGVCRKWGWAIPELPDVVTYVERLRAFLAGRTLRRARSLNPFVLRSVQPPLQSLEGRAVTDAQRIGKRIVLAFDGDVFLVIHLMIAGRLRWRPPEKKIGGRLALAAFEFDHGTLWLTEAGTTRRAMMHVMEGRAGLAAFDRGGLDVLSADLATFTARLRSANHTLKRALTDPRLFDGMGNAYSDEILHRARLSPLQLTSRLDDAGVATLHRAARETLTEWTDRLRRQAGDGFPEEVTAFHEEMAVHGRFGRPCPVCGAPVQRIRYAANETNYCARCQTGGRVLADRAMSRLLREDWPRSIDELD